MRLRRKAWSAAWSGSATWLRLTSYWPGPFSAHDGVGGEVLAFAGVKDVGEQGLEAVELGDGQDLGLPAVPAAFVGAGGGDGIARGAPAVDDVEFELGGHDGGEPGGGDALGHAVEDLAGVRIEGRAVLLEHAEQELRGGAGEPGDGEQRAFDGHADAVGVTGADGEAGFGDVTAPDIQRVDAAGEGHAFLHDFGDAFRGHPFAAGDAVDVHDEGFEDRGGLVAWEVGVGVWVIGGRGCGEIQLNVLRCCGVQAWAGWRWRACWWARGGGAQGAEDGDRERVVGVAPFRVPLDAEEEGFGGFQADGFGQAVGCRGIDGQAKGEAGDALGVQRVDVRGGHAGEGVQEAARGQGDFVAGGVVLLERAGLFAVVVEAGGGVEGLVQRAA